MTLPALIIIASWSVFLLYWGASALWVKPDIKDRSYLLRGWKVRLALGILLLIAWYLSSWGFFTFNLGLRSGLLKETGSSVLSLFGSLLTVAGIAFAIWARFHLGRNWSSHPTLKEGHELVTSGPYAFIRHPIYTGVIAAVLGSACVSLFAVAAFVALSVLFIIRVLKEEQLMQGQFPHEYPQYKKHTWALIPFVW